MKLGVFIALLSQLSLEDMLKKVSSLDIFITLSLVPEIMRVTPTVNCPYSRTSLGCRNFGILLPGTTSPSAL